MGLRAGIAVVVPIASGSRPCIVDTNGDGYVDVFLMTLGFPPGAVMLVRGDGTLMPAVSVSLDGDTSDMQRLFSDGLFEDELADLDGDGLAYLAFADLTKYTLRRWRAACVP